MGATRTHTCFFSEEALTPLREVYVALSEDFDERRPYIDDVAEEAGDARLDALRVAIAFLAEPVP
jgi:hypothetical protein